MNDRLKTVVLVLAVLGIAIGVGVAGETTTVKPGLNENRRLVDKDGNAFSVANPLPASVTSSALPTGAATAVKQTWMDANLAAINGKIMACNTGAIAGTVSGTGTAGTPAAGVLTVQGVNSGQALSTTDANSQAQLVQAVMRLVAIATDANTLVTAGGGGYIRQDSTATMAKETGGNLAKLVGQAGNVLVTKDTWIDISTITGRLATLDGNTATTPNTATGTLYGSTDGGVTSCWVITDWTGDPIQGRVLTAHTVAHPLGTSYRTSIGFVRGPATHVQWKQASQTADDWVWRAIGQ